MQSRGVLHLADKLKQMDITLTESEKRGDRTGKIVATVGAILIVALLLWPIFFFQNPPPGQPGILVNLGIVDMGQGEENAPAPAEPEPEEVVVPTPPLPQNPPPPPPRVDPDPQPEQREVVVTEDPEVVALRKQKAREEAQRQAEQRRIQQEAEAERRKQQAEAEARRRQEAEAERQRQAEAEAARRRQAEADALKGQLGGAFGQGSGNGNTGRPGNQGVDNGDPNADRLSGISTGSGRVSGGLSGRGVLASPPVQENSQVSGTVVIEVCVNPRGEISRADYTQNGSSTADPALVAAARKNALRWRFAANELAPAEQCGRISYNFKVQ
ncbi:outer membrane transport energization protein TonB [Neolewinella xylanilytica]|uniref:Outer membrane transport energization protein TonB n=2 Tax=Neolewinella xylanilytica TaxID=1514080 RepID=A0A2S6I5P8_9BACT|nr:outer membrane transport energization protein TonB [Neolewinella xylanilytica]